MPFLDKALFQHAQFLKWSFVSARHSWYECFCLNVLLFLVLEKHLYSPRYCNEWCLPRLPGPMAAGVNHPSQPAAASQAAAAASRFVACVFLTKIGKNGHSPDSYKINYHFARRVTNKSFTLREFKYLSWVTNKKYLLTVFLSILTVHSL